MKTRRLLWSVALLLSATIGRAQFAPEPDFDSKYATELVKAGTHAPDFKMKTIDGKTFKLSQLKGKTVVLDFWAS